MFVCLIKKTTGWMKLRGMASSLTCIMLFLSGWAQASTKSPTMSLPLRLLGSHGIPTEGIKSTLFLKTKQFHNSMSISEMENADNLKLTGVTFYGESSLGVSLRTRCEKNTSTFTLEECKGSVCSATLPNADSPSIAHIRRFNGEYGQYSLSRLGFHQQKLSGTTLHNALCGRSWPAWALKIRHRDKNTPLTFPNYLLLVQYSTKILFVNALSKRIWMSLDWDENRGVFNQATISTDGKILLKNSLGEALYIDFKNQDYVAIQKGHAFSSPLGHSALFAHSAVRAASETSIEVTEEQSTHDSIHLGGVWSNNSFVTWSDLTSAFKLKKAPVVRLYPDGAQLISTTWSEESGIDKSYILLLNGRKMELHTTEDGGHSFTRTHSISDISPWSSTEKYVIGGTFLTRVDSKGGLRVLEAEGQTWPRMNEIDNASALQNGFGFLLYKKHQASPTCWISFFTPHSDKKAWEQVHVMPSAPCSTGIGRSGSAVGLAEMTRDFLKIYIMESASP